MGRLAGGFSFPQMAFDVLHHDDGVVDDDADGEDQAEEREAVERESEGRHNREGADQGHWNGDHRNDRRPPALQENHDHDDD